jgi:hypothetical protein
MAAIKACPAITRMQRPPMPVRGVYVFYENDRALYIGRTNRMRDRLMEHGRASANHLTATFAFKLAKEVAKEQGFEVERRTRNALCADPEFAVLFTQAKARVREMSIRYIAIDHPVEQYLFEVYAAEVLNTSYNDFENH